jgi:hypothetical protein
MHPLAASLLLGASVFVLVLVVTLDFRRDE